MTDIYQESLAFHRKHRGKIALKPKLKLTDRTALSLAYTPGVAGPSRAIAEDPERVWELTSRGDWIAVITDGSSVLGLGNIGPAGGMPVMEGKCVIFKEFSGLNAFPIALKTQDVDRFVEAVKLISLSFGAVNLEDISAPRCFDIEERLKSELDIPVMHDDQHATAIVVIAGLMNALKLTGRTFAKTRFVVSGAGAAGVAVLKMLREMGAGDIIVSDRGGILSSRRVDLDRWRTSLLDFTNLGDIDGDLDDAMVGREVFIGLSGPDIVSEHMVRSMAPDPIIFALANPTPEIMPELAKEAGAAIVATGRSDFPNQVNNALAFPGVFQGVLEAKARSITEGMKLAAAKTLASYVTDPTLERIVPGIFEPGVARAVADAVRAVARA
ncbi:MAG: NADP-dependent malic enzyme [Patescibacteria group bacterium]